MNGLYLRKVAIVFAVIACATNAAFSAEKWTCEMEMSKGKTYTQEWIVSYDAKNLYEMMFAPKGKGYFRV